MSAGGAQAPNAGQRRRWNDPSWTAAWLGRERITSSVTALVMQHLGPKPAERVLDIGTGGGPLALEVARAVGPAGSVLGADISEPLVEVARRRAQEANLPNVSFAVADVQTDDLDGAPFDAAASQFGVMFFEGPTAAFANVGRHMVGGGRLVFACWLGIEQNPWCILPVLAPFAPPPPEGPPGAAPTGPFAFGDPAFVARVLEAAGWQPTGRHVYEVVERVERAAIAADDELALAGVPGPSVPEATRALRTHLGRFEAGDGHYEVPLAFQVISARWP